jgi:hypothetical protein
VPVLVPGVYVMGGRGFGDGGILLTKTIDDKDDRRWVPLSFQR